MKKSETAANTVPLCAEAYIDFNRSNVIVKSLHIFPAESLSKANRLKVNRCKESSTVLPKSLPCARSTRMLVQVLLFAAARELVDSGQVEVEVEDSKATTFGVVEALGTQYPCLKDILKTSVLAVNYEYVDQSEDRPVSKTDEIALIPPVSGG